jgi:hypothetical protein
MGAPFRDENATLVARNSELEVENASLRRALDLTRARKAKEGAPLRAALMIAGAFAMVTFACVTLLARREPAAITVNVAPAAPPPPAAPSTPPKTSPPGAQNLPFVLVTSDDPADWQKAREILEPTVYAEHGTLAEVRLLRALCIAQGDYTCADVCRALEFPAKSNVERNAFELAATDDPSDRQKARELLEPKVFSKRGTPAEIRLLKAICKSQGDFTCVETCRGLSPAP